MEEIRRILRDLDRQTGALLLYLLLIPLFVSVMVSLFAGDLRSFLLKTGGFVLWSLSAALVGRGIREEIDYKEATVARASRFPAKAAGAVLLGATVFYLGAIAGDQSLWKSLFVAALATAGTLLYYGLDPRTDKVPESDEISADLLLQTLTDARDTLETIRLQGKEIRDLRLHRELEHALEKAEAILDRIEQKPAKLRMARKVLVVYIDGVDRIVQRYRNLEESQIDEEMKERLYRLMREVQERFDRELERMESRERFELDVQIDALKEQIKN